MNTGLDLTRHIHENKLNKFLVMIGSDFGMNQEYLDQISKIYGPCVECDTVDQVVSMVGQKRLIPLSSKHYIVRHDLNFLPSLDLNLSKKLNAMNIVGFLSIVIEDNDSPKLSKFLDDKCYLVSKMPVNFLIKHLNKMYSNLSSQDIKSCIRLSDGNFGKSKLLCYCLQCSTPLSLSFSDLEKTFKNNTSDDIKQLEKLVFKRDTRNILQFSESCNLAIEDMIYEIMHSMLELEKLICNKHNNYKCWNVSDIYIVFSNCYFVLNKYRSTSCDQYSLFITLISCIGFKQIPLMEDI